MGHELGIAQALADVAPVCITTRDDLFRHILRYLGIPRTTYIMRNGRTVQDDLEIGFTPEEISSRVERESGMNPDMATWFVAAAMAAFHPWRSTATTEGAAA